MITLIDLFHPASKAWDRWRMLQKAMLSHASTEQMFLLVQLLFPTSQEMQTTKGKSLQFLK